MLRPIVHLLLKPIVSTTPSIYLHHLLSVTMPRTHKHLYKPKRTTVAPKQPKTPPKPAPAPSDTPSMTSGLASTMAHGVSSGVGWGIGSAAVKSVFGAFSDSKESQTTDTVTTQASTIERKDACSTMWIAYQSCLHESGGRACDTVKEGFERMCPGFHESSMTTTMPSSVLSFPTV